MFWESVLDGLRVLLHWETYVLGLIYIFIMYIPFYPLLFGKGDAAEKGGCLAMILQPFFVALGSIVFVLTLFPIILGLGEEAVWSAPWLLIVDAPVFVLIMMVVMVVLMVISVFIPIIGEMQSFQTLISGGTVIVLMIFMLHKFNPEFAVSDVDITPGILMTAGILIISALVSYAGLMLSTLLVTLIERKGEGVGSFLIMPLASVFGFIPVFIYGAWIGNQLAQ